MNIKYVGLIIVLCLLFLSPNGPVTAGEQKRMMVKIPHEFTVSDQALPAGRYSVSTEEGDPVKLHIHDLSGETCAWLPVITRLALHAHADTEARMVFDRVGGQHFLSEVWLPGKDGFLIRGTPKDHSHEIIHFGS